MACDTPLTIKPKDGREPVLVPCGKCPPCKVRRVRSWMFRLKQEEKNHVTCHFVTFTYDTTTVPISKNGFMELRKKDLQDFFKRLRKNTGQEGIKYYAVGEYGSKTRRPHYHAIIYGVQDTNQYFTAWNRGSVYIGSVSGASIAYTLKYIDKPSFHRQHERDDRAKEFSLMSKGLGKNYVDETSIRYHNSHYDELFVTDTGGVRLGMPKYYRQMLFSEDLRKEQTEIVQHAVAQKEAAEKMLFEDSNPPYSYEEHKERVKYARYKNFYHNQKSERNKL